MCHLVSGRTHSPLHHFFLTLDPAAHGGTTHLTIFSLVRPRLMTTCVFLGAFAIPALPTLLLTSLHLDLSLASSSATPLTPRDIGANVFPFHQVPPSVPPATGDAGFSTPLPGRSRTSLGPPLALRHVPRMWRLLHPRRWRPRRWRPQPPRRPRPPWRLRRPRSPRRPWPVRSPAPVRAFFA